jgi:hypothetical protein
MSMTAILSAALVGGGLTGTVSVGDPAPVANGVADRIYRGNPIVAVALAAQIVNACVAAG